MSFEQLKINELLVYHFPYIAIDPTEIQICLYLS